MITPLAPFLTPVEMAASLAVWRGAIEKRLIALCQSGEPVVEPESEFYVVYIADRTHPGAEFALHQCMSQLGKNWGLQVIVPEDIQDPVVEIVSKWPGAKIDLASWLGEKWPTCDRNSLMRTELFWHSVRGQTQLFIDGDTFIRHGKIDPYVGFDYIAPLWGSGTVGPWCPFGSGELSLRKRSAMLDICKACNTNHWLIPSESVFYSIVTRLESNRYNIPDEKVAASFAIEKIFHPDPFAMRKAWKYIDASKLSLLI